MTEINLVGIDLFNDVPKASIEEALGYLQRQKVIGIDIETSRKYKKGRYDERVYKPGLDPYMSNICMLQIGTLERVFVIDVRQFSKEALSPITNFLHWNDDVEFVMHNSKFESKFLHHNYGVRFKHTWDTMLVEMNLTNGLHLGYGLADVAGRYLGTIKSEKINLFTDIDQYNSAQYEDFNDFAVSQVENQIIDKSTRLGFINIGNKPFTKNQILYGADDITMPLLIRKKQKEGRDGYNPKVCNKLENKFAHSLADLELKGIHFDAEKWLEVYERNNPIFFRRKGNLDNYVIANVPKFTGSIDLFNPNATCAIEWSSSKQVISLFRHLGFCPKEKSKQTKRMEWSVGSKALQKLLDSKHKGHLFEEEEIEITCNQSLIVNYLLFKKSEQARNTFGKDWLKNVHPVTGRVHSSYRQIMNTGRVSSTNPIKLGVYIVIYKMNCVNSGNPINKRGILSQAA